MRRVVPLLAVAALLLAGVGALPGVGPETVVADAPGGNPIHPGALMSSPVPGCTLGFILTDGVGGLWATTAGHCTHFKGQEVRLAGPGRIGSVAWRVSGSPQADLAVIRIDPTVHGLVSPSVPGFGAASGLASETAAGDLLNAYGWGYLWAAEPLRAKTLLALADDGASVTFAGPVAGGDSGSPVLTEDGLALGLVTWATPSGFGSAAGNVTKLAHLLPQAGAALGVTLDVLVEP